MQKKPMSLENNQGKHTKNSQHNETLLWHGLTSSSTGVYASFSTPDTIYYGTSAATVIHVRVFPSGSQASCVHEQRPTPSYVMSVSQTKVQQPVIVRPRDFAFHASSANNCRLPPASTSRRSITIRMTVKEF